MKPQHKHHKETKQEATKNKHRDVKLVLFVIGTAIVFYALSFSLSYAAAWLLWANELFNIN